MEQEKRIDEILQSFREVNKVLYTTLLKAGQPHNLTPVQLWVLKVLAEKPGIRLSELADRLSLGNSTMSGIVDRMEKANLAKRERSEEDRRSVHLRLTEHGEALWRETNDERQRRISVMLELPDEDIDALLRIHRQIVQLVQTRGEGQES